MFRRLLQLLLVLGLGSVAPAQQSTPPERIVLPDNLATTAAGKTVSGKSWLYLVIQPSDPASITGKAFRVYLKPTGMQNAGTFSPIGEIRPVTDPATIQVMLQRAWILGDTEANIAGIAQSLIDQWKIGGQSVPSTLHGRIGTLIHRSSQSQKDALTLRQLAIAHPAFRLPLGLAWGGPIAPSPGTICTAEVRELDAAGNDAGVVGRCEFAAGQAAALVAPGNPVQVIDLTPEGDLKIKLRWSVPNNLRRQSLQTVGFRVWRVPQSASLPAQPTLSQVLAVPGAKQVTIAPVLLSKLYTSGSPTSATDVLNFTADPSTFYIADDNGRDETSPIVPTPASPPYVYKTGSPHPENTAYKYYVAALDWLKQPGPLSTAGTGTAVRTTPPPVPAGLKVEEISIGTGSAATRFRLSFDGNSNNNPNVSTQRYAIYRGGPGNTSLDRLSYLLPYPALPIVSPNTGHVSLATLNHAAGRLTFNDSAIDSAGRETQTFWYSVRAIHDTPLGAVYSAPSPPVFGTFHDRQGPASPDGSWIGDHQQALCRELTANYVASTPLEAGTPTLGKGRYIRIRIRRIDPHVLYAHVLYYDPRNIQNGQAGARLYFPPGENEITVDQFWVDPATTNSGSQRVIGVICGAANARLSYVAWRNLDWGSPIVSSTTHRTEVSFECATSTTTGLAPANAFSSKMLISPGSVTTSVNGFQVRATLPNSSYNGFTGIVTITRTNYGTRKVLGKVSGNFLDFPDPDRVVSNTFASYSVQILRTYQNYAGASPTASDLPPSWPSEVLWPPLISNQAQWAPGPNQPSTVTLVLPLTPTTKEYRIYRQIDGGELSLIASGLADADSSATSNVVIGDSPNLPVSGRVCYYGQFVDQSGNTSPLKQIDPCIDILAPTPVPVLNEPKPLGNSSGPQMGLEWFCPPQGVRRFRIRILDLTTGQVVASSPSATLLPAGTAGNAYFNPAPPNQLPTAFPEGSLFATNLNAPLPGSGSAVSASSNHTATFNVQLDHEYQVEIHAEGIRPDDIQRSLPRTFTWKAPVASGAVAWPARPLPVVVNGASSIYNLVALELRPGNPLFSAAYASPIQLFDAESTPVIVPIGLMPVTPNGYTSSRSAPSAPSQQGSYPALTPKTDSPLYRGVSDPNAHLTSVFPSNSIGKAVPVLPVALYRQIVAAQGMNTTQTADLVQVSPLVSSIAWRNENGAVCIVDPLIVTIPHYVSGSYQHVTFWIPDTHPVVVGHTYRYFLVRFDADSEIDQVIDCGTVTISP